MISARTAVDVYRIEATDPVPHGKLDFCPDQTYRMAKAGTSWSR
jgi:hypothetical protein